MQIDKATPVPAPGERGRPTRYPFREMEIGDSVLCEMDHPYPSKTSAAKAAWQYGSRTGRRFVAVREGEKVRIWREK